MDLAEDPGLVNHRTRDLTFDMTEDPGLINHRTRDLNNHIQFKTRAMQSVASLLSLTVFPIFRSWHNDLKIYDIQFKTRTMQSVAYPLI
jgi:hypothetical protein